MPALRLLRENGYKADDIDSAVARADEVIIELENRVLCENDPDYRAKLQVETDEKVTENIELIAQIKGHVELSVEETGEEDRSFVFYAMQALAERDNSATQIDPRYCRMTCEKIQLLRGRQNCDQTFPQRHLGFFWSFLPQTG